MLSRTSLQQCWEIAEACSSQVLLQIIKKKKRYRELSGQLPATWIQKIERKTQLWWRDWLKCQTDSHPSVRGNNHTQQTWEFPKPNSKTSCLFKQPILQVLAFFFRTLTHWMAAVPGTGHWMSLWSQCCLLWIHMMTVGANKTKRLMPDMKEIINKRMCC